MATNEHSGESRADTGLEGEDRKQRMLTIIVEGTPHEWPKGNISYDQVVTLEVPDYADHPDITYSVKFKKGHGGQQDDILAKGESIKIKDGMIFSVSETGQS